MCGIVTYTGQSDGNPTWRGADAAAWLLEAAATGTNQMNVKMADAVALTKISGTATSDEAWAR